MNTSKLLLAFTSLSLVLTACGATETTKSHTKLTYQVIRDFNTQQVSTETVKVELEKRLSALGNSQSTVTIEGEQLHVDTDLPEINIGKALDMATAKRVTIHEPRTTFSPTELAHNQKYNQHQKDIVTAAHEEARKTPENIDAIVTKYSDEIDLLNIGRHGPIDELALNEPKIWAALVQTPEGGITPVVELSYVVWFAKVIAITTDGDGHKWFHYQQVSRNLKENGPYLNYMPVVDLSGHITKVSIVKKNPEETENIKDYTVHATLDSEGQRLMSEMSKKQLNRSLRLFIDDLPYTTITLREVWSGTDLVLDDEYTDINAKDLADRLNQLSLSTPLALVRLEQY